MRKLWVVFVMSALVIVLGGLSSAVGEPAMQIWDPPGTTIVKVTGDRANGFGIFYKDGSSIFPPTDSEAMAECSEYDARVDRVRCRAEVRTWYRDLADLRRSIRWAHYSERAD